MREDFFYKQVDCANYNSLSIARSKLLMIKTTLNITFFYISLNNYYNLCKCYKF